jgi:hypothetical protein
VTLDIGQLANVYCPVCGRPAAYAAGKLTCYEGHEVTVSRVVVYDSGVTSVPKPDATAQPRGGYF